MVPRLGWAAVFPGRSDTSISMLVVQRTTERKIGLARAMSKLGFCSRSRAADLICSGRVHLNGVVKRDPETPVRLGRDKISVEGDELNVESKIYLMMNKPRGLVTTVSDEKGRETVYSVLQGQGLPWVAPVGRLDKASEGLLLMTNDSEWSAHVTAPGSHLDKTYHVQIGSIVDDNVLRRLSNGIRMESGEVLRAKSARMIRSGEKNCWLEIVLDEGKNRQIRRMLETVNIDVLRLVRVAIGPLELGNLPKGAHRLLNASEKQQIDSAIRKTNLTGRVR